jgi:hypothetical protein
MELHGLYAASRHAGSSALPLRRPALKMMGGSGIIRSEKLLPGASTKIPVMIY